MAPYSPLGQRGHGLFGQLDFPRGPHPAVRAQLLDPHSPTWRRGNLYLRAFSRDLDLLLAELVRKVVNPNLTAAERARARSDLAHLRRRLARHGRPSARRPGRPPKLTANEREAMADEHERLLAHLRDLTSNHSPSAAELDQLFATRGFADRLLGEFPCRGLESERHGSSSSRTRHVSPCRLVVSAIWPCGTTSAPTPSRRPSGRLPQPSASLTASR